MNKMNLGFEVRYATYDDIEAIAQITSEAFKKYAEMIGMESVAALCETYDDIKKDIDENIVLVAFSDGMPVGSVRVRINADNTAYLYRFGVRLQVQNNGIGKSLMSLVDIKMREMGIKKISLHTGSKVASLVKFYYGRGFYIDSTAKDCGYVRAHLVKEY